MQPIIKNKNTAIALLIALLAVGILTSGISVFAFDTDDGGGCCGGEQHDTPTPTGENPDRPNNPTPEKKPAVCNSLTVTPKQLPAEGGKVTVAWKTSHANKITINHGIGEVNRADGSREVRVDKDTTFVLTVKGGGAEDTCKDSVKLKPPVVIEKKPSCDAFTASPKNLPAQGGDVTLTWATTNAKNISINQGIGEVNREDGSRTVNVKESKTFVLTASNVAGSVTCSVPVKVDTHHEPKPFSCDYFNSNKTVVEKGESFTLSWGTTNADSVSINNGIGSVADDGTHTTSIQDDETYVLTATKGNKQVTCSRSIEVDEDEDDDDDDDDDHGGGSSSPSCDMDISDKNIEAGDKITLSWDTTRADEVVIKDNHGRTILDTDDLDRDDRSDFYDGDITLRPTKNTTYTLTASKGSKDRTCKESVKVENEDEEVTIIEVRDQQPTLSGIQLTQVPYTGFEAGPVLTYIFYALLALWALFIAYTLVLKKKLS